MSSAQEHEYGELWQFICTTKGGQVQYKNPSEDGYSYSQNRRRHDVTQDGSANKVSRQHETCPNKLKKKPPAR